MRFTKMQGAGNDFVLVETGDMQRDWPSVAAAICDRHYGVGADGLLLLIPSQVADFRMRIFNADGSEASACGNGLRCLVKHFIDKNSPGSEFKELSRDISVETTNGIRRARVHSNTGKALEIQTSMGEPRIGIKNSPAVIVGRGEDIFDIKSQMGYTITVGNKELLVSLVSMGNKHAVYFVQGSVSDFPLSEIGPKVEQNEVFPDRVNFEIAKVISHDKIEARVWESGVGETLACGSGACAITVAARLLGYVDARVSVQLPGGILRVEWDRAGEVLLSGPAETVFSGEWPE
jgi:diaminopimelate epimerase